MSTTTSPAPVTPPPRLGAPPHAEEPERAGTPGRWAATLRWLGDATSIVLLVAVLWWLARHDGGFARTALAQVGLLALAAVPAAASELRRVPAVVRALVGLWALGLVASLLFAAERSGFAEPTVTYALVPVVGLSAYRIWRRRWGPPAVAGLLLVSFGLYWYEGFLTWWGLALFDGRQPEWRVLSWHNQSGVLMVAFGLLFGGVALAGRRLIALAFGLCAAAAFAGAWLAGSRGAVVVLAIGALVLIAVAARARGWRTAVGRALVIALASFTLVAGLLSYAGAQGVEDVARVASVSGDPAEANFLRRLLHMEAAVGMFVDAPLTGQGVGSYRNMARPFTSPDSGLTSSAHNEYAEVLGEGGLALVLPFLGLAAVAGVAGWRRFRSARLGLAELAEDIEVGDLRWPLSLGAVAAVSALLVHQGADFDWGYPVIPALLAIAVAVAGRDVRGAAVDATRRRSTILAITTGVVISVLLVAGSGGVLWQNRSYQRQADLSAAEIARVPVAWDIERASQAAFDLTRAGDYDDARWALQRTVSWNPGYHPARVELAIVDHAAGDISGPQLVDVLFSGYLHFASANKVAAALIDGGEYRLAESVSRSFLDVYPRYESWGIDDARAYTWYLLVRAAAEDGGCAAAQRRSTEAANAEGMADPTLLEPIEELVSATCE